MTPQQLLHDAAGDVVEIEPPFLRRDLRVKDGLQEQIAQLLPQIGVVARVDRLDDFVRLLDQSRAQAGMGLLAVPRAPIRRPQPGDDGAELLNGRLGMVEGVGVGGVWHWGFGIGDLALGIWH